MFTDAVSIFTSKRLPARSLRIELDVGGEFLERAFELRAGLLPTKVSLLSFGCMLHCAAAKATHGGRPADAGRRPGVLELRWWMRD